MRSTSLPPRPFRALLLALAFLALAFLALSCRDAPVGPDLEPAASRTSAVRSLVVDDGDLQSGTVGTALAAPLVVMLRNHGGQPVAGVPVRWSITSGRGTLAERMTLSGRDGRASVTFILDTVAGSTVIHAELPDSPASVRTPLAAMFTVTALAGPPARITIVSGDAQADTAGRALDAPLVVRVTDRYGNPVAGATVTWSAPPGSGTVAAVGPATNDAGIASATWTLGDPGQNVATASVAGAAPAMFGATALAPLPVRISLAAPNPLDTVAALVDVPAWVSRGGMPGSGIGGHRVDWEVIGGGGSLVVGANLYDFVTDPYGYAMMRWRLGDLAGTNRLVGCAAGDCDTVTVTTRAGRPVAIVKLGGDQQAAVVRSTLPTALTVAVRDRFGNDVGGIGITWTPLDPRWGSASPATSVTDATGARTAWTLGEALGTQQLAASAAIPGGTSLSTLFSATALSDRVRLVLIDGGGQSGYMGAPLARPIVVRAIDDAGLPRQGVSVTWLTNPGNGSLSPSTAVTGPEGFASAVWTLGWSFTGVPNPQTAFVFGGSSLGPWFAVEATGRPAPVRSIVVVSGNEQSAQVMTQPALPFVVEVRDAVDKPLYTAVWWTVTWPDGSTTFPDTRTTSPDGRSYWSVAMGPRAGLITITATANGLPVTFSVMATPAPMCATSWTASATTAPAGGLVTLTARLEDQYGNVIADGGAAPQVTSGGGYIEGGPPWRWRLGPVVGTQTARVSGYSCRRDDGSAWGTPVPFTTDFTVTTTAP